MAKITRKNQLIFGSDSGFEQIGKFGSLAAGTPEYTTDPEEIQELSNYLVGWYDAIVSNNAPALQDWNALCYLYAYQLAYIFQAGVAEWNTDAVYYIGSLVNDGYGNLYVSLTNDNTGNALTSGTNWALVGGGFTTYSTTGNISLQDNSILVSGSITRTLPASSTAKGKKYTIKKTDSNATTVTIEGNSTETIDGALNYSLIEQYQFVTIQCDGSNWWIIAAG